MQLHSRRRRRRARRIGRALSGHLRGVRWGALAYLPPAVALIHLRRPLKVPRPVSLAAAAGTPVSVARALPAGRGRAVAVWLVHMWAYKISFEIPYDRPEKLRQRLRIDPPITADTMLGLGTPPGQRLQRRLRRPPILSGLDKALTLIYMLWEPEPHVALGWILWRHPRRFPAAALRLGATFDATLLGYFLMPTAPPWWASEQEGRMEGQVRRVTVEVIRHWRGERRPVQDHSSGANPWASMPSDHFASAVSTALALAEADRRAGALGWTYALLLGGTLVYTGEHYVIDLLAGLAVALTIHAVGGILSGPLTRAARVALAPARS